MLTRMMRLLLGRKPEPYRFLKTDRIDYNPRINRIGLYIHIPFCRSICNFCPYNKVLYNKDQATEYIEALLRELTRLKKSLPDVAIESIYVGGGTPSLLKDGLRVVFERIRTDFKMVGDDIAVELHPGDCSVETLGYLKEIGVNMVSVGIQSFNKEVLRQLTRHRIQYDPEAVLTTIKEIGFKSVDVDLIFGIKGVSLEQHIEDFHRAIDLGANQISTYPLIPFTFTPLGKKHFTRSGILSGNTIRRRTLERFDTVAKQRNFYRSSIWSFTKNGSPRYSSVTRTSFLGIGASATSLIGDRFAINTFSIPHYIEETKKRIPVALSCRLSERDEMMFWLFWQSYNTIILHDQFKKLFGKELDRVFKFELKAGQLMGLLKKEGLDYRLTKRGAYLFHLIEQAYTHTYLNKTWGTCMKTPFPEELTLD